MELAEIKPKHHFRTIFHISDVHIHNAGRYHEYHTVFETLVNTIKTHPRYDPETSLIINTGDTLDRCGRMSAEAIDLTHLLRTQLVSLAYNLWIPGNHDVKRDNDQQTNQDSLTAILAEHCDSPNFMYQTETGVWLVGDNLAIYHISAVPDSWRDASFLPSDLLQLVTLPPTEQHRTKIALCHAGIDSAIGQNGYLLRGCEYKLADFEGFDLILLGDTHQYQLLGSHGRMAYPGSLIQQNFGEDLTQHGGCLVWNLDDLSTEFIHIPNQYSFRTFTVQGGKLVKPPQPPLSPYVRLRLLYDSVTTPEQLRLLPQHLQDTHNCTILDGGLKIEPLVVADPNTQINDPVIHQTYDADAQFRHYLQTTHPSPLADALISLDTHYKQRLDITTSSNLTTTTTKILQLTWTNLFNYTGGPHQISFNQLVSGIISIYGKNKQGKSKIVETLLVALYGSVPRRFPDIITKGKTSASTSVTFQIGNDHYQLTRTFRTKGGATVRLLRTSGHETSDLSERKDKRDIETLIIRLVGSPEILLYTNISKQDSHQNFTTLEPKAKTKLLKKILDTEQYDKLYREVKSDLNTLIKGELKPQEILLQQTQTEAEHHSQAPSKLTHIQTEIQQLSLEYTQLETEYKDALLRQGQIESILPQLQSLQIQLRDRQQALLPTTLTSEADYQHGCQAIQLQQQQHQTRLTSLQSKLQFLNRKLHPLANPTEIQRQWSSLTTALTNLREQQTQTKQQLLDLVAQRDRLQHQLTENDHQIATLQTQSLKLTEATVPQQWTYPTVSEYQDAIGLLTDAQQTLQLKLTQLPSGLIDRYTTLHQQFQQTDGTKLHTNYREHQQHLEQYQHDTGQLQRDTPLRDQLTAQLDASPYQYNQCCTDCTHNQQVDRVGETRLQITTLTSRIQSTTASLDSLQQTIQSASDLPSQYKLYTDYETLRTAYLQHQQTTARLADSVSRAQNLQQEQTRWTQWHADSKVLTQVNAQLQGATRLRTQLTSQLGQTTTQQQQLTTQETDLQQQLATTDSQLLEYTRDQTRLVENQTTQTEINSITTHIDTTQANLEATTLAQIKLDSQFKNWNANLEQQTDLQQLQTQIHTLEQQQRQLQDLPLADHINFTRQGLAESLTVRRREESASQHSLTQLTKLTQTIHTIQRQITQLREQQQRLTHYLEATKQFPTLLVKQSITHLQDAANKVLLNMTREFSLVIDFDESKGVFDFNRLDLKTQTKTYLEYCSGYERFAIGTALRHALSIIGHTGSLNMLIIDEGFGVMDRHHLANVSNWLEPLTKIYDHLFIITHIEELQNSLPHKIIVAQGTVCCQLATQKPTIPPPIAD